VIPHRGQSKLYRQLRDDTGPGPDDIQDVVLICLFASSIIYACHDLQNDRLRQASEALMDSKMEYVLGASGSVNL